MKTPISHFAALAGLLSVIGLLAPPTAHGTDGLSDREILIGSSLPLSGPFSFVGLQSRRGMEACFASVNAAGGVHGRALKLVAYDDGYEPIPCVRNTIKLLDEDKVFALCTYVGTPTAVKAMRLWQDRKTPVVGFFTGAIQLRQPFNPYNIHVRASYHQETAAIIDVFVRRLGFRKIAIFHQNDAFGEAVKSGAEAALQKAGLTAVAYGSFERNTLDIEKGLAAIRPAAPDAIIMVGTYAPLAKFVKTAKAAGLAQTLFHTVSFVGPESYAGELGPDATNCLVTQVMTPYADLDAPLVRDYLAALHLIAPDAAPSFPGFEAYANARVLVEGLRRAGPAPTREGLIRAIESITDGRTVLGLPLAYGPADHEGLEDVFITHVQQGQWLPVTDWSAWHRN